MTETRDARIDRLRAVAATSHLRSPLARWLSANHDEFARLLEAYRPRWEALIEQFGAEGLLELPPEFTSGDPHLRAMTRRKIVKATMRIWERVKHRLAQTPTASPPGNEGRSTEQPPPAAAASPAEQQAQPPRQFGTATLRGHTPSVPAPPRAATPVPEFDSARADRVIAELLAGQVKGRFAPKIDEGE